MRLEPRKSLETLVEVLLAIEPAVNGSPGAGCEIDQRQIALSHELVDWPVGFSKEVSQFNLALLWADPSQSIANSSRSTIVTLSKAGGEDQYSFHDSLGKAGKTDADGSLMDIYARQSKL